MTVSKAYSLLEKEGVLEFVRGQGMRIGTSNVSKKNLEQREDQIIPILNEVVTKAQQLSLSPKRVIEILQEEWKERKNG